MGLYTRWFNAWALLAGWAVGTGLGTWMFFAANNTTTWPLTFAGWTFPGYTALYTLVLNLVISVVLTPVFNVLGSNAVDKTAAADYHA